jgi:hypothetical protein
LWLTDLHFGQHGQNWLWQLKKDDFLSDLAHLHAECGPWDVVLFTGDLVFCGSKQEFDKLTPEIQLVFEQIRNRQAMPVFLSVPGNHDLERPARNSPSAVALRSWLHDEDLRNEFWENPDFWLRCEIDRAFQAYTEWSGNNGFARPADYRPGLLPGDFSATIVKDNARLGIVGLNTTFLQVSSGDYEGKLEVHPHQLVAACGGDPAAWLKQRHASFLLTHQPHTWLSEEARQRFRSLIYTPNHFAAHFYGHMHRQETQVLSEGADIARRHLQGVSLFGLESFGKGFDHKRLAFGYSAGRLEIDGERGRIYIWPRVAVERQSGLLALVPDQKQSLAEGCQYTRGIEIDLRLPCATQSVASNSDAAASASARVNFALPASNRRQYLEQLRSESIARCIMRWQAARVTREMAVQLANDPAIGSPTAEMCPDNRRPIVLLIGPVGAGKSLTGERLHQSAIERALVIPDAPTPVYIEVSDGFGDLSTALRRALDSAYADRAHGAAVFVHEAIGSESADIRIVLSQARVLVNWCANTTVVLCARERVGLTNLEESVQIPALSDKAALELVNRVSGLSFSQSWVPFPPSVCDAIRRPLFALLLGHYLRTGQSGGPRSMADLIKNLADEAVHPRGDHDAALYAMLCNLAKEVTDRGGGSVPITEVVPHGDNASLQHLLDTGLVTKRGDSTAFPLALFTEWFAAQSLVSGQPAIDELVTDDARLRRWYYPILIAVGTQSHEKTTEFLSAITRHDAALSSKLIDEGLALWGGSDDVMPPSETECGKRLIDVAHVWVQTLGPLARLFPPIKADGSLRPLGVRTSDLWLHAGWYFGNEIMEPIVRMPESVGLPVTGNMIAGFSVGNNWSARSVKPGTAPAWAWRWVRDDIATWIADIIVHRRLPPPSPAMRTEAAWEAASVLAGPVQRPRPRPHIELADLEGVLAQLLGTPWIAGYGESTIYLEPLRTEVATLRSQQQSVLAPPWMPQSVLAKPERRGHPWQLCTVEELSLRIQSVYEAAIDSYRTIISDWFPALSKRMMHSIVLPADFVVDLRINLIERSFMPPVVFWTPLPLPHGYQSSVHVYTNRPNMEFREYREVMPRYRSLRPEVPDWVPHLGTGGGLAGELFQQDAVTQLTYEWLKRDLKILRLIAE